MTNLTVKRTHMPYPGIRLQAGLKVVIEPDWLAEAMVKRGWFNADEVEETKEVLKEAVPETSTKTKSKGKKGEGAE